MVRETVLSRLRTEQALLDRDEARLERQKDVLRVIISKYLGHKENIENCMSIDERRLLADTDNLHYTVLQRKKIISTLQYQ